MPVQPVRHPVIMAALWMTGTVLCFTGMAVAARELSLRHVSAFQMVFFRSVGGMAAISALLCFFGWHHVRTRRLRTHVWRNAAHLAGQTGWVYGIAKGLPLLVVSAIEFTTPVWVAVLAALFLGEHLRKPRVVAIAICVAGVLIILRPGAAMMDPATLAVLGAAVSYGVAYILTKRLTTTEKPLTVLFYMTIVQLPLTMMLSALDWKPLTLSPLLLFWAAVIGLTALAGHYCITRALMLADAMVVVPMDFLRLILLTMIDVLCYHAHLEAWEFVGAALIMAGNLFNIWSERKRMTAEIEAI